MKRLHELPEYYLLAQTRSTDEPRIIIPASTVIIFREAGQTAPEILMVRRSRDLAFAGAASVFPGGKVHDSDERLARTRPELALDEAAARIAGIREVLEETGLVLGTHQRLSAAQASAARAMLGQNEDLGPVLAHFGWTLDLEALTPFARWLPTFKPGRIFDTRFYLANLGSGRVDLTPDLSENTRLFWTSAAKALTMVEAGEIKAIYPTRRNLERLAQFDSFSQAEDHARTSPMETISPWIERRDGVELVCIPEGLGYPVTAAPLSHVSIG